MKDLLILFTNNLLPIFLVAGAGYAASKWLKVEPGAISKVVFYLFTPCLVFDLLAHTQLENGDIFKMFGYAALTMLGIGGATYLLGKVFIKKRKMLVAVILTSTLMNSGAFGLPLNQFAFGDQTLAYATIYFISMAIFTYTLGVMVASLGSATWQDSFRELLKTPVVYAMLLGFLFMTMEWQLPDPLDRSVSTLSDAAVPGMLVLLGIQLQQMKGNLQLAPLLFADFMRLGGGLAVGLVASAAFGLGTHAHQAGVVESAMPSAINSIVLATEYDVEPDFVTMVVFSSTLLSPLTLTPLLFYLGL
ncbi:MAG: hypothetical protein MAG431_01368 [Chloroflexi bacterium]|nr:hypothetical protein [Chloroflexota bacterium]